MQLIIIILLILAVLLVIFTLQNTMEVTVNVFLWEIKEAPLVIVLLVCTILGYLIASFYFYPKLWKLRREFNQLTKFNKELKELQEMNEKSKKPESDISTNPEGIKLEDDDDFDNPFFKD